MTLLSWIITLYISIGIFVMAEAIVVSWQWPDFPKWVKIVRSIISILIWPVVFIMN